MVKVEDKLICSEMKKLVEVSISTLLSFYIGEEQLMGTNKSGTAVLANKICLLLNTGYCVDFLFETQM